VSTTTSFFTGFADKSREKARTCSSLFLNEYFTSISLRYPFLFGILNKMNGIWIVVTLAF